MKAHKDPALVTFAARLHAWLLIAYPREFRRRFGVEMTQVFKDAAREAAHERGNAAVVSVFSRCFFDHAVSATAQRLSGGIAMTNTGWMKLAALTLFALASAIAIGWVDTHEEDVQMSVLLMLLSTGALSFFAPRATILWILLVGLAVPAAHALAARWGVKIPYPVDSFASTFLALIPATIGGVVGASVRLAVRRMTRSAAV